MLGGLIQDSLTDGTEKLPYAGDVPVFGSLFRYDTRVRQKTNLMIFLKPTIVRTGNDGRELTSERYDYLRGEQLQSVPGPRWFWTDPTMPELPPQGILPGTPQSVLMPGASRSVLTPGPPQFIPPRTSPAPPGPAASPTAAPK